MTLADAMSRALDIETPSRVGAPKAAPKAAGDENFPVASRLIAPRLRPHVAAFYAFARAADDIADDPTLSAPDQLARLDLVEAALTGRAQNSPGLEEGHQPNASWLQIGSLIVLAAVFLASVLRRGTRAFIEQIMETPTKDEADDHGGHCHAAST